MSRQEERKNLGFLGEDFQFKLVHTFFDDKNFFKDLHSIVDQNMFTNPQLKTVVGVLKEYYETEEIVPSYTMMKIALNNKAKSDIEREIYSCIIDKIKDTSTEGVEMIRDLADKFFKQQNIIKTANEILRIAGDGDISKYERCVDLLGEALNQGTHEDLGCSVFDDLEETLSDDYRTAIPTGIGKVDEALEGGLGKGELGVIIGSSSFGKAQPLTSKIITPNGVVLMGDINVGDKVVGRDGKPHNVSGIFPQGVRSIYQVTFSNGTSCECDIEHLWTVKTSNKEQTLTLREILQKTLIGRNGEYLFQIPNNELVEFNEKEVNINPYEVGKSGRIIPEEYIYNSSSKRIELLQGLMDENGFVNEYGWCQYAHPNKELVLQVQYLIRSLGGEAKLSDLDNTLTFTYFDKNIPIFKDKILTIDYDLMSEKRVFIAKINYVGEQEAQCIMVDSEEHLYLTEEFIVTHNTSLTTSVAAHAATYKCEANGYEGFKVLQIVFEDRIKQIQRKHLGKITGVEAKDLSKSNIIEGVKEQLNKYEDKELLKRNLRIKRFPSGEITASFIGRFVKKLINSGFKPDMVIVDYFECLEHHDSSGSDNWIQEGKTMRKFESLAGDLDIALWIPVQGTRDSVNMELVTMDKAGGSFKKIQIAHIVMSIARTMEDIESNKATIAILKNRAGKAGKVFNNVEFNNGTCRISTDNVDEYDNMMAFNKNQQKELSKLQSEIFDRVSKKT